MLCETSPNKQSTLSVSWARNPRKIEKDGNGSPDYSQSDRLELSLNEKQGRHYSLELGITDFLLVF